MPLFIVQHTHTPETCPARNPKMAPMLLSHLSKSNAEKSGVRILSEAVLDGQHTLYLTVEARDDKTVSGFMQPFTQVGSVKVFQASRCEKVVERGFC